MVSLSPFATRLQDADVPGFVLSVDGAEPPQQIPRWKVAAESKGPASHGISVARWDHIRLRDEPGDESHRAGEQHEVSPVAEVRNRPARERGESDDKQEGSVFHGDSSARLN